MTSLMNLWDWLNIYFLPIFIAVCQGRVWAWPGAQQPRLARQHEGDCSAAETGQGKKGNSCDPFFRVFAPIQPIRCIPM